MTEAVQMALVVALPLVMAQIAGIVVAFRSSGETIKRLDEANATITILKEQNASLLLITQLTTPVVPVVPEPAKAPLRKQAGSTHDERKEDDNG